MLGDTVAQPRFRTTPLALFAVLALVLAVVGIAGLVAVSVAERRHEMGVRMALGASGREVLATVLRQGVVPVAVGMVGAVVAGRALAGLLFGVSATDLVTFRAVPLTITGTAIFATWLPARRAARGAHRSAGSAAV